MSEFRVPTMPLQVELRCADGRRFVGDVYLPAHSSRHHGPMRADEWVNTVARFFPFRPSEGPCRSILNRDQVVAFTLSADANTNDEEAPAVPIVQVDVQAGGHRFQGEVLVDMPRNQQRVVDLLNSQDPFLTVRAGSRHHLVQKVHISRVVELTEN